MKKQIIFILLSFLSIQAISQTYEGFKVEVSGKGQPIIFIPGYSCSGEVWKETVDHLKDRYECHVLTLAGFAGVPPIASPILESSKNDIIRYVKEKHLDKPILIGHSLGAFMSLWLSSDEPNLFSKLICIDGLPFLSALSNPNANADSLKKNPMFNPEAVAKRFESLPTEGYIENSAKAMMWQVSDSVRARQIATWGFNSDRRTLGLTLVEMSTTDLRKDISKIKVPVLVLGSIYSTKENSLKIISGQYKNIPQAHIKIADSKHFIMYDQPQWMYAEIDSFLGK